MGRKRAPHCGKCGKALRKGQGVMILSFARYGGLQDDGRFALAPWLTVFACTSHEPAEVRQAVAAMRPEAA